MSVAPLVELPVRLSREHGTFILSNISKSCHYDAEKAFIFVENTRVIVEFVCDARNMPSAG
jgi:hypothetical protein